MSRTYGGMKPVWLDIQQAQGRTQVKSDMMSKRALIAFISQVGEDIEEMCCKSGLRCRNYHAHSL